MRTKRGRKPKVEPYFGQNEEDAVVKYLESNDLEERNLIYNTWLREPLNKMVESIIRKYGLYRKNETFEDLHADTLSFLITKAHKFEQSRGKKAYSYYGTICKHYLLGNLIKDEKTIKTTLSYDEIVGDLENRQDMTYVIEEDTSSMDDLIVNLVNGIKTELSNEGNQKKRVNENERKVGVALIELLENWETAFDTMSGGSKYNKNSVLETLRNYTNLSTKDIRVSMRRFKQLYGILKEKEL
jgi:hypothetical protein